MFGDMFGGDMFGGDMFGGGGGSDGGGTGTMVQIGGLEIQGRCVQVDDRNSIFTLGPVSTFPFQVDKPLPAPEGDDTLLKEAEAAKLSPQELANRVIAAKMGQAGSPAAAFETALRMSQLFDADPKMTLILSYSMSNTVQNLVGFKMQVKFSMNIDYLQVK